MKFTLNELNSIKLILCLWFFIFDSCIADVIYAPYQISQKVTIRIEKEITSKDLVDFKSALRKLDESKQTLHMNSIVLESNGGDGEVAREIGKLIRTRKLNTFLAEDTSCSSACVYVLLGGVQRYAFGNVRIHRATFMYDSDTDNHVEKFIKDNQKSVNEYVKTMGISLLLADAMENTVSWEIRQLTDLEKKQWQVLGFDRLAEELYFNQSARERHISRIEFIDIFKSNYDDCLLSAREFKQTVFDCAKTKNLKEPSYYKQFFRWLDKKFDSYVRPSIKDLSFNERVEVLRSKIRNGSLYLRYASISEVDDLSSHNTQLKSIDSQSVQKIEATNEWWTEENKIFVHVSNPTASELKEIFFELSTTDCKNSMGKKRLLSVKLLKNLEAKNSAIYSAQLPFNYNKEIGKGTRCGLIKGAYTSIN